MEVDWVQRQLEGYTRDGSQVFSQLIADNPSSTIVNSALDLLITYLSMPAPFRRNPRLDEVMVRLTWALYTQVHNRGYWDVICVIWPKMQEVARRLPDPAQYAEVSRQLAITLNDCGAKKAAQQLYEELLASPQFAQITLDQQADILHQAGVCFLDQGNTECAQQVLTQCLNIAEPPDSAMNIRDKSSALQAKARNAYCAGAMIWESKAYAYNQLGHLCMTQGGFAAARHNYEKSLRIFLLYGEEENLACVAYQALGCLLVRQKGYEEATPLLQKNLALRQRRGEKKGSAYAAAYLAESYLGSGKMAEAEALLNEAISACVALSDRRGMALCHFYFGHLEQRRGNLAAALHQWQRAQALAATIPIPAFELQALVALTSAFFRTGRSGELRTTLLRLFRNIQQQKLRPVSALRLFVCYLP